MARPPKAIVNMNRAIREKNIDDLLWSYVELMTYELRENIERKTFSGRDITGFVSELSKREDKAAPDDSKDDAAKTAMLNYLKPPTKSL